MEQKKTLELKTNREIRPCNGCPGKIQIGQQMIVTHGGELDPQYFHMLCHKPEAHKK